MANAIKNLPTVRWRSWQRRKNTFIYYSIVFLIGLIRPLPFIILRWFGIILGTAAFLIATRERRLTVSQLRVALPELKYTWFTAFQVFIHFGQAVVECLRIEEFVGPDSSPYIDFPETSLDLLRVALRRDKGILFVSPHIGNWEVLAQATAQKGFPFNAIAHESYDPRLTRLITDFRESSGVHCLWRGDPNLMHNIIQVLKRGEILGVLIDQDIDVPSIFVPFFGRLASTPVKPAYIACKYEVAVIFGYAIRKGKRYHIHLTEVPLPKSGDLERDAFELTAELTRRTEEIIRCYPTQWVWMHRRWKTRPENSV